jgi:hypothetical protein
MVVIEGTAAEIPAVLVDQGRMVVLDPTVDIGHHHPLPEHSFGPHLRGPHRGDIPLDPVHRRLLYPRRGLRYAHEGSEDDPLHRRKCCHALQCSRA